MPQSFKCCDDKAVLFIMAFTVPGSPRVPANGGPLDAYFDNFVVAGPAFEMDHPRQQRLIATPPVPITDPYAILPGNPLDDEDECDRPQLAFAIGCVLSGT